MATERDTLDPPARSVFYYGCWGSECGHYLHDESGRPLSDQDLPPGVTLELMDAGTLPTKGPQDEGAVRALWVGEWTIVSWWDRSVDTRLNSNVSFAVRGNLAGVAAVARARAAYPSVFDRFRYPLTFPDP